MLLTFMVAVADASSASTGSGEDEKVIASRYRVQQRLAKGGMGIVYRAFDPVHQRSVALKRLHSGGPRSRQRRMFEREYATLVGLRHPRIIDVHEYGVDAVGPYYTMELLDGRDLRELSPLPASLACRYLRDVASSLALLHARRLLHRDLSPRNVRITEDKRAKLIDFGGLATFGKHSTVVGTPPCVPPEALRGAALDQRADLYSLGALAYFLLTGRHAYEIRTLTELANSFRSPPPPPPSQATGREPKEPIIAELDELVMALLSRDPMARPASAAEVIARLSAIAGLSAEREPQSATSYLLGGKTIGRARERAKLRGLRKRAVLGQGGTVILDAVPGMGAARILEDLALEAQLTGAVTAVVDARTARGTLGVANALLRSITRSNPALAEVAASGLHDVLMPMLAEESVEVRRQSTQGSMDADPRERRLREQRALVGFFERLTEHASVVLCVRGLEHTDESSATLLWALSQSAPEQSLLIVLAVDPMQPPAAPAAVRNLTQRGLHIALQPLSPIEVHVLVETSFGPVPGTERMAAWLHRVSGGNPLGCIELLRHLLDAQAIRFAEGVWALPAELSSAELPTALEQVIEARIDRLPADARTLANALCVARGRVSRERCLAIGELVGVAQPAAALDALVEAQIVIEDQKSCRLSHETLRRELSSRLDAAERKRLHRVLGSLLSDRSGGDPELMLDAGWHLLNGGDEQRGATLLADAGAQIAWNANAMPAAIPALRAALDAFRSQKRGAHELARLLGPLVMAGYYTDRRIMEQYGDEALATLAQVTGIARAERWGKRVGSGLGAALGLGAGLFGFVRRYGWSGVARFRDSLTIFMTACGMLVGLAVIVMDGPRARRYAGLMKPLLPLGGGARLAHDLSWALSLITEDRQADAVEQLQKVVTAARKPAGLGLSEGSLRMLRSGALYALGSTEALCEDPRALDRATELDGMGSLLFEMFANQIRSLHHSLRGETSIARDYRAKVESYALQAGSSWQAEVWAPSSRILACELVRDLEEAKRIMEELDRLAAEIPSIRRHAALARSSYHKLRGDSAESMRLRDPVRTSEAPRSFNGWSTMMAGHVLDCARTDQLERALKDGREALGLYAPHELIATSVITPLHVELALAEAEAGELDVARERIESALARTVERGGPATRGTLHEAAARIALVAGDRDRAVSHQLEMERCFRPTGNPLLVARCERLKRAIARLKRAPSPGNELRDTLDLGPPTSAEQSVRPTPRAAALHEISAGRASVPPGRNRS
jgi:hypothetical protein